MLPLQRVGEKLTFGGIGRPDLIFLTKAERSFLSLDRYFFDYNLAKCSTFAQKKIPCDLVTGSKEIHLQLKVLIPIESPRDHESLFYKENGWNAE